MVYHEPEGVEHDRVHSQSESHDAVSCAEPYAIDDSVGRILENEGACRLRTGIDSRR